MNGFSAFLTATRAFNPALATGIGALPQAPCKAETELEIRLQLTGIQLRVATFIVEGKPDVQATGYCALFLDASA